MSSNDDFDPDAFLADSNDDFDPDAFLSEDTQAVATGSPPSPLQPAQVDTVPLTADFISPTGELRWEVPQTPTQAEVARRAQSADDMQSYYARLDDAFKVVSNTDLGQEQQVLGVAQKLGLPTKLVRGNVDMFRATATASGFNAEKWASQSPELFELLKRNPGLANTVLQDHELSAGLVYLNAAKDWFNDLVDWDESEAFFNHRAMYAGMPDSPLRTELLKGIDEAQRARRTATRWERDKPRPALEADTSEAQAVRAGTLQLDTSSGDVNIGPGTAPGTVALPGTYSGLTVPWQRAAETWNQMELSRLGFEEMTLALQGKDTTQVSAKIHDMRMAGTPLRLGDTDAWSGVSTDMAQGTASTSNVFKDVAKRGGAGAAIGYGLGFIGGAAVSKTLPGANAAGLEMAGALARFGGQAGAAEGSFRAEAGSTWQELEDVTTETGRHLTMKERAGGALLAGAIKAGIEVLELRQLVATLGPAGKLATGSTLAEVKKQLATSPAFRQLVADAAIGLAKSAGAEALEEGTQQLTDDAVKHLLVSETARRDIGRSIESGPLAIATQVPADLAQVASTWSPDWNAAQESMVKALPGVIPLGLGGSAVRVGLGMRARAAEITAAKKSAAVLGLVENKTVKAAPGEIGAVVSDSVGSDTLHVDPQATMRLFQDQKLNPAQRAAEADRLFGPDGFERMTEAAEAGHLVEVPVAHTLAAWTKEDADALAQHSTTQEGGRTQSQLKEQAGDIEAEANALVDAEVERMSTDEKARAAAEEYEASLLEKGTISKKQAKVLGVVHQFILSTMSKASGLDVEALPKLEAKKGDESTSGVEDSPYVKPIERLRTLEAKLSPEKRVAALMTDSVSGLRTETAWNEAPRKPGQVALITSPDMVKAVNDSAQGGHDVSNAMLRGLGGVVAKHDNEAARFGPNFAVHVNDEAHLQQVVADMQASLPAGARIVGAIGPDIATARDNLDKTVDSQRAAGTLAPRGTTAADISTLGPNTFTGVGATPNVSPELAARATSTTGEAFVTEAYLDPRMPGVLTRLGFEHAGPFKWVVAYDVKGLRLVNDKLGKEIGTKLLLAFAEAAKSIGGEHFAFAHFSGDEFASGHETEFEAREFARRLEAQLRTVVLPATLDGVAINIRPEFRAGVGEKTYGEADKALNTAKTRESRTQPGWVADSATGRLHGLPGSESGREGGVRGSEGPVGSEVGAPLGEKAVPEGASNAEQGRATEGDRSLSDRQGLEALALTPEERKAEEEAIATAEERNARGPLRAEETQALELGFNSKPAVAEARDAITRFSGSRVEERQAAATAFLDWVENAGPAPEVADDIQRKTETWARAFNVVDPQHGLSRLAEISKDGIDPEFRRGATNNPRTPQERAVKEQQRLDFVRNVLGRLNQTTDIMRGEKQLDVTPNAATDNVTNVNVAMALQDNAQAELAKYKVKGKLAFPDGVIPKGVTGEEAKLAIEYMANQAAAEVAFEASPERVGESGFGWYSQKFGQAIDVLASRFPELKTDKTARGLFTLLTAVSSDGEKVSTNLKNAVALYESYRGSKGKAVNRSVVQSSRDLASAVDTINSGIKALGVEGYLKHLTQEATVGELKEAAKEAGRQFKSDFEDDTVAPMATLEFGPKLGSFFGNLMGNSGYLTMDRWWSRTVNRYRGRLLTEATATGLERMKALLEHYDSRLKSSMSEAELLWYATQLAADFEDAGYKPLFHNAGFKLNRAAVEKVLESNPDIGNRSSGQAVIKGGVGAKAMAAWGKASTSAREKYLEAAKARLGEKYKAEDFEKRAPREFVEAKFFDQLTAPETPAAERRTKNLFPDSKYVSDKGGENPEVVAKKLGYDDAAHMLKHFEVMRAANTIFKNAFLNLNDSPESRADRTLQINTAKRTVEILKGKGIQATVADVQAALWYYEKHLYATLGAKDSSRTSYLEEARRLVGDSTGVQPGVSEGNRGPGPRGSSKDVPVAGQEAGRRGSSGGLQAQRLSQLPTPEESKQQAESHLVMLDALREAGAKPVDTKSPRLRTYIYDPAHGDVRQIEKGIAQRWYESTQYRDGARFFEAKNQDDANKQLAAYHSGESVHDPVADPSFQGVTEPDPQEELKAGLDSTNLPWEDFRDEVSRRDFLEVAGRFKVYTAVDINDFVTGWLVKDKTSENRFTSGADVIRFLNKKLGVKPSETEAALNKLNKSKSRLFQDSPSPTPKGYFFAYREALAVKRIVNIFINKTGDVSTGLHEAAHTYLEMLGDVAETPGVKPEVKESWANAMQALGIASRDELGVEQHEKFARGFERYFMEGHASQPALQRVFTQLKLWLLDIYKSLRGLPGDDLSPELKAVFDGLLATKEERDALVAKQGPALFSSAKEAGLTDEEWAAQLQEQREAVAETSRKAELLVLKDRLRVTEAWWKEGLKKLQKYFADEYENLPARKAQLLLEKGKLALDRKAVEEVVGKLRGPGLKTVEEGGVRPAEVAEAAGFPNAASMLSALVALKPKERWVVEQANAEMEKQHPSVLTERTELRKAVSEGLQPYTEKRILSEWAALKKKDPTIKATPAEVLKRAAAIMVERRRMGQLSPGIALTQERAAARRKAKAALKGEWQQAALEARTELLNAYLYHELQKASDEKDKLESTASRLSKLPARARLGKASPVYRDAVDVLLSGFGLAAAQDDSLTPAVLQQAVAQMNGDAVFVGDPDWLAPLTAALGRGKAFEALTVSEARQLSDALENLQAAARQRTTVLVEGKRMEREAVVAGLLEEARTNKKQAPVLPASESGATLKQKAQTAPGSILAPLLKIETMIGWLGGSLKGLNPRDSFWHKAIFMPLESARQHESDLHKRAAQPILDAWEKMPKSVRDAGQDIIDGASLFPDWRVGDGTQQMAAPTRRYELLVMALNMGNESNAERLTKGYNITEAEVVKALGLLSKEEIDWVNSVGKSFAKLWPEAEALEERVTGVKPKKLEVRPLQLKNGVIEGHYYPAVYDKRVSAVGEQQAAQQVADMMDHRYTRPSTSHSYTKGRAETFFAPISLEPQNLAVHLTQEVHDIAFRERLMSVGSLLLDQRVQAQLKAAMGQNRASQFLQWAKDAGTAPGVEGAVATGLWMNLFLKARANNMLAAMAYSVPNFFEDLSAIPAALADRELEAKYIAPAVLDFMKSPFAAVKEVEAKSAFMRASNDSLVRDLTQNIKNLSAKGITSRGPLKFVNEHAFVMIETSYKTTATPVWIARYQQALEAGESEERAIQAGDAVIRRLFPQHSTVNAAGIVRNKGFIGVSLQFYGFQSAALNVMLDAAQMVKEAPDFAGRVRTLARMARYMAAISLLAALLRGRGPDKDEEWERWGSRTLLNSLFSMFPFGSEVGAAIDARIRGKPPQFRAGLPGAIAQAGYEAVNAVTSDEESDRKVMAMLRATGAFVGLPVSQPIRTGKYLYELGTGAKEARGPGDVISGVIYGENQTPASSIPRLLQDAAE